MLINSKGVAIRINIDGISRTGRTASGVKLMRSAEDESIVAIAKIGSNEDNNEDMPEISIPEDLENLEEDLLEGIEEVDELEDDIIEDDFDDEEEDDEEYDEEEIDSESEDK